MFNRYTGPTVLTLLLAMLLGGLAACSSTPTATPPLLLVDSLDAQRIGYRIRWASSLDIPESEDISHAVVFDDILLIIESPTNLASAISLRDGSLLWRRIIGERFDTLYTPAKYQSYVLVNSNHQLFFHDLLTGDLKQIHDLEWVVGNGPCVQSNLAIFGAINGRVFAHDLPSAQMRWEYQLSDQINVRAVDVNEQFTFIADANGVYGLFLTRDGTLMWKGKTFGRISAQPVVSQLSILVPSEDHSLYALSKDAGAGGDDRWIHREIRPITTSPIIVNRAAYLPGRTGGLTALDDVRGGQTLWTTDEKVLPVLQRANSLVLFGRNSLLVVDANSGTPLHRVTTDTLDRVLPIDNQSMLLISPTGRVVRLDPSN